jgi:hypothetical protein
MNDDKLTLAELKAKYAHGLFASRDSIGEAMEDATKLIETLPKRHRLSGYVAMMLVSNAILDQAVRCELREIA